MLFASSEIAFLTASFCPPLLPPSTPPLLRFAVSPCLFSYICVNSLRRARVSTPKRSSIASNKRLNNARCFVLLPVGIFRFARSRFAYNFSNNALLRNSSGIHFGNVDGTPFTSLCAPVPVIIRYPACDRSNSIRIMPIASSAFACPTPVYVSAISF